MSTVENTKLTVAVQQARPLSRGFKQNLERVIAAVHSHAGAVDVMVWPELFLSGYQTENLQEVSLTQGDARLDDLVQACKTHSMTVITGAIEQVAEGFYNVMLSIDGLTGRVHFTRKTHLFGSENEAFLMGDVLEPVQLHGVSVGVINCFELEFPEVPRTLALKGAELFLAGSANIHPYADEHRLGTRARVFENGIAFAYANRVGYESGYNFCGHSNIIDHLGRVIHEGNSFSEDTLIAQLEIVRKSGTVTDILGQRRPSLYLNE